jgi:predicted acetyltransferase
VHTPAVNASGETRLVPPSIDFETSFREAVAELGDDCGRYERIPPGAPFRIVVQTLLRLEQPRDDGVPRSIRWLVTGNHFIGRVQIAHRLSDGASDQGGHINYVIRPSERGKGHGRRILDLALREAYAIGLDQILLTVLSDNPASESIIKACGGILTSTTDLPHGMQRRRYFIVRGRPATCVGGGEGQT